MRKHPEKTSPRKLVPTGDRTRARCVTGAHAITWSTAVDTWPWSGPWIVGVLYSINWIVKMKFLLCNFICRNKLVFWIKKCNIQGALKFPLQTSRTCRGDWFHNILNWNPCPETYRFRATAIWKQALPERTSRVSASNSFVIRPPAELHDEGCLDRIMWCQLTFIVPLGAGSSFIHVFFSVRATWLSTLLLNTPTWSFCMSKLDVMEELFVKIVFHNVRLHRISFSP